VSGRLGGCGASWWRQRGTACRGGAWQSQARWGPQAQRTWERGWRWASLFHFMQTLTHTLRELKNNTLTHTVSVPHFPMRHGKTLG
jgi:hypothetical protein